jgi:hypothetical protein
MHPLAVQCQDAKHGARGAALTDTTPVRERPFVPGATAIAAGVSALWSSTDDSGRTNKTGHTNKTGSR